MVRLLADAIIRRDAILRQITSARLRLLEIDPVSAEGVELLRVIERLLGDLRPALAAISDLRRAGIG